MMTVIKKLLIITLLQLGVVWQASSQTITTRSLIDELTNLNQLAEYPENEYTSRQYSSYDRRSTYPDAPGWFTNSDGFGGEPIPGFEKVLRKPEGDRHGEYLICDLKGPGAVVRLWTAHIEGNVRLYIDGESDPVYDGPAQAFFHNTYEAIAGLDVKADWNTSLKQNTAGYYPLPFSKSLRLVWEGDIARLHFYHLQVRLYDKNARVKSFSKGDILENMDQLNHVAEVLNAPEKYLDQALSESSWSAIRLKPGERKTIISLKGPAAISHLASLVTAGNREEALRQTLMEVRFDGAPWGQIQSPIGDFYGAAPGINPYTSLPFTVESNGKMICRFLMPFRESAEIILSNFSDEEVTVSMNAVLTDYTWKENKSMYFRARWRVDHALTADPAAVYDIPYLLYRGKGRMVGAVALIMNPTNVPSSYGNWWGEGDEKIFIDNQMEASFIGTGSEDYFNYAWSSSAIFSHAFCGQPRNDGPANRGFVTNYRWHILDDILFKENLDFFMELYPHRPVEGFSYARQIYLYAFGTGHDDHIPISRADLQMPQMPHNWWPVPEGWAANAIFYQIEDLLLSGSGTSLEADNMWSDGYLLNWQPRMKGDELTLRLPITESGKYMLAFTTARRPGNGVIEILLNGEILLLDGSSSHDHATNFRVLSRNLKSGSLDLEAGLHTLLIRSADDKQLPVGLDFIWVKKN